MLLLAILLHMGKKSKTTQANHVYDFVIFVEIVSECLTLKLKNDSNWNELKIEVKNLLNTSHNPILPRRN